jgi:hypothetical protein
MAFSSVSVMANSLRLRGFHAPAPGALRESNAEAARPASAAA